MNAEEFYQFVSARFNKPYPPRKKSMLKHVGDIVFIFSRETEDDSIDAAILIDGELYAVNSKIMSICSIEHATYDWKSERPSPETMMKIKLRI